jgi:hypothetical protein
MKEAELNSKVSQKLADFEMVGNIMPSSEWNELLMKRISVADSGSRSNHSVTKYTIVMIFIVLVNLGFIVNSLARNTQRSSDRTSDLNTISKEMMVNPIQ